MTRYVELSAAEVDITQTLIDASEAAGAAVQLELQHTAPAGNSIARAIRIERRPSTALTDRLGPGHRLEPGGPSIRWPWPDSTEHVVCWADQTHNNGRRGTLAVTVLP